MSLHGELSVLSVEERKRKEAALTKFVANLATNKKGVNAEVDLTTGFDIKSTKIRAGTAQLSADMQMAVNFEGITVTTESADGYTAIDLIRMEDAKRAKLEKAIRNKALMKLQEKRLFLEAEGRVDDLSKKVTDLNQYKPKLMTTLEVASFKRSDRTSWAKIQAALQDKIEPNELYEKNGKAFDLTTYSITLFMLGESEILNKRLSDVEAEIKDMGSLRDKGAVIIAQSAGVDEFFIENFEFKSILGGAGVIATTLNMTLKSPYQADLIDYIFKAAMKLGIRNHNDIPLFILIEWKAREHETQSPVPDIGTSRCISVRTVNMGLNYNVGGGDYNIEFVRYAEQNFNQTAGVIKEDILIGGETVGEVFGMLIARLASPQTKGSDTVIFPDHYTIELPPGMSSWKLVNGDQYKFSEFRSKANSYDWRKTVSTVHVPEGAGGARSEAAIMQGDPNAGDSSPKTRTRSQVELNIVQWHATAQFKRGTPILTIIENILASTKEMQAMMSALPDPQGEQAQKEKPNPIEVFRQTWKVDADTKLIIYDHNRRLYAVKRYYRVFIHLDPKLSEDEENTRQTKEFSAARLLQVLNLDLLKKAYSYFYTGMNTEVKSIDFNFDNHWIVAKQLYSKMITQGRLAHGINANPFTHGGSTDPDLNKLREDHDNKATKLANSIKKLDTEMSLASAGGPMKYLQTDYKKKMAKDGAKLKQLEKELDMTKKRQLMDNNLAKGIKDGTIRMIPTTENSVNNDLDSAIRSTGGFYFKEVRPKFSGITYVSDLQNEEPDPGVLFPVSYVDVGQPDLLNKGVQEDFDRGRSILSQIYNNRLGGDMIKVVMEIRGDPYWIPESYGDKPNAASVSPTLRQPYCIVLASQGNEYNQAGIMQINERHGLNAIYNVIEIENRFSGGEFSQTLTMYRDHTIDLNAVIRKPDVYAEAMGNVDFTQAEGWE